MSILEDDEDDEQQLEQTGANSATKLSSALQQSIQVLLKNPDALLQSVQQLQITVDSLTVKKPKGYNPSMPMQQSVQATRNKEKYEAAKQLYDAAKAVSFDANEGDAEGKPDISKIRLLSAHKKIHKHNNDDTDNEDDDDRNRNMGYNMIIERQDESFYATTHASPVLLNIDIVKKLIDIDWMPVYCTSKCALCTLVRVKSNIYTSTADPTTKQDFEHTTKQDFEHTTAQIWNSLHVHLLFRVPADGRWTQQEQPFDNVWRVVEEESEEEVEEEEVQEEVEEESEKTGIPKIRTAGATPALNVPAQIQQQLEQIKVQEAAEQAEREERKAQEEVQEQIRDEKNRLRLEKTFDEKGDEFQKASPWSHAHPLGNSGANVLFRRPSEGDKPTEGWYFATVLDQSEHAQQHFDADRVTEIQKAGWEVVECTRECALCVLCAAPAQNARLIESMDVRLRSETEENKNLIQTERRDRLVACCESNLRDRLNDGKHVHLTRKKQEETGPDIDVLFSEAWLSTWGPMTSYDTLQTSDQEVKVLSQHHLGFGVVMNKEYFTTVFTPPLSPDKITSKIAGLLACKGWYAVACSKKCALCNIDDTNIITLNNDETLNDDKLKQALKDALEKSVQSDTHVHLQYCNKRNAVGECDDSLGDDLEFDEILKNMSSLIDAASEILQNNGLLLLGGKRRQSLKTLQRKSRIGAAQISNNPSASSKRVQRIVDAAFAQHDTANANNSAANQTVREAAVRALEHVLEQRPKALDSDLEWHLRNPKALYDWRLRKYVLEQRTHGKEPPRKAQVDPDMQQAHRDFKILRQFAQATNS